MNTAKIQSELVAIQLQIAMLNTKAKEARREEQAAIDKSVKIETELASLRSSRRMLSLLLNTEE